MHSTREIDNVSDQKINIAISVFDNIFDNNGLTVRPLRIMKLLNDYYDLFLISNSKKNQQICGLENIKMHVIKSKQFWNLKLIPVIIKNKFDLVYCSNDLFGFLTYYLLSKLFRYKIIYESHSIVSKEAEEIGESLIRIKFYQIIEKFVTSKADHVIALSENTYNFYKNYNKNITLIPVFVDDNLFRTTKELEIRRYERNFKLIGVIGPFDSIFNSYALEFLYDNIEKFDEQIKFIIIGKCSFKIENERIKYTGYINSINEYVRYISSLNAVFIPSNLATMGPLNKIIEPMACSTPVFTTPKGFKALYHTTKYKDILIFEEEELINQLNQLIFDDIFMKEIGKNARLIIEKYYSEKINKNILLKVINNNLGY